MYLDVPFSTLNDVNEVDERDTIGIASNLLGRDFIVIEKEDEFIEIAIRRKNELSENIESLKSKISDLRLLNSTTTLTQSL